MLLYLYTRGIMMPVAIELSLHEKERFLSKIRQTYKNDLWHQEWTGPCSQRGHGNFWIGYGAKGRRKIQATHISWFLHYGIWPSQQLLHLNICHWPACVDVAHLYEGTPKDNHADAIAFGTHPGLLKPSTLSKLKQREALIGRYQGQDNPMWGRHHSSESRQMMSVHHADFSGEKGPASKLTDMQRREIWRLYRTNHYYQRELAEQFGVNQTQISRIVRARQWAF